MGTRKSVWAAAALVTVVGSMLATGAVPAGASSSPADQGVTKTTITVGLPYVDFAALADLGVNINDGSFPDAYTAVADAINKAGGIDGRKIEMQMVSMNPALPASENSSCTQLTEDDHVFVSISPVFPDCYQQTHDTPVIVGSLPGALPAGVGARLLVQPARHAL